MTVPAIPTAEPATQDVDQQLGELEDLSFGRAIFIGSTVGIVAMTALIIAVLRVLAPEEPWGVTLGIAVWTGVWAGLFLGGTVTVGRWSASHH